MEMELQDQFGPLVKVGFVDVLSQEMSSFAEVNSLIQSGKVKLPLVVINGRPRFHGGVSKPMIAQVVEMLLQQD